MRIRRISKQPPRTLTVDESTYPGTQHARWGQNSHLQIPTAAVARIASGVRSIANSTHPEYDRQRSDWEKWRLVYEGGDSFIDEYLKKFSRRESNRDFQRRKEITPTAAFAKAAINEIKNSIFQRMIDTTRTGGPESYQQAVKGQAQGVDLKGATMNWLIGHYVLPELLTMKKVGVFVDNKDPGFTLRDKGTKHPYFYIYRAENILNWVEGERDANGQVEYTNVLLRDFKYNFDPVTRLPISETTCYRHMFIEDDGKVAVQFYSDLGVPQEYMKLEITRIPLVVFEISDSLLKDVSNHQISLMNLESSDINYLLLGNFPFYIEQTKDTNSNLLKAAQNSYNELVCSPGTDTASCNVAPSDSTNIEVGVMQGRRYPMGADAPAFIAPSSDPLEASMAKQDRLKADIRILVHLALSNIQPKMASAESKDRDLAGLESGLSYIGIELEHGEQQLASYWSMYEGSKEIPTVKYPQQWSLKTPQQVKEEVDQLQDIRDDVPSLTLKKELNKRIATTVIANHVTPDTLRIIHRELETAKGASSNPSTVQSDVEAGFLSQETGTMLRGYEKEEAKAAAVDHAERLRRIQEAQSSNGTLTNPGARGLPDLSPAPALEVKLEREGKPTRGAADE